MTATDLIRLLERVVEQEGEVYIDIKIDSGQIVNTRMDGEILIIRGS